MLLLLRPLEIRSPVPRRSRAREDYLSNARLVIPWSEHSINVHLCDDVYAQLIFVALRGFVKINKKLIDDLDRMPLRRNERTLERRVADDRQRFVRSIRSTNAVQHDAGRGAVAL